MSTSNFNSVEFDGIRKQAAKLMRTPAFNSGEFAIIKPIEFDGIRNRIGVKP